jgi:hypothetical protein
MLSCLKSTGVEFVIVGAYALAAHGFPRATGDIDILLSTSPENARRVLAALTQFGAPVSELSERDLTAPDSVLQIGVAPCRIDLLTSITGVKFAEAWRGKVSTLIGDLEVNILSKADLLKNKLAAGRDKDQGDIAWLRKNL